MEVSKFRRKISPYERLYWGGQKVVPPFVIQVFVEGEGTVPLSELELAVAQASQSCPGARMIARGKFWEDQGQTPPVRVVPRNQYDGFHLNEIPALRESLDPVQGPTCEVLFIPGEKPVLIFRAFHGVMDGRGVLFWIQEVFRALRGEPLRGATSSLTDVELVAQLGYEKRRRKLSFQSEFPLRSPSFSDRSFFWKRRTLPGKHPALVAKLASAAAAFSQRDQIRWMVPVDIRHHDPKLQSTANLSLPIFLDVQKGDSWEVLHERILKSLAQKQELSFDGSEWALSKIPVRGIEAFVRAALRIQHQRERYLASGVLSHLGKIELKDYSGGDFFARTVYSLPVHVGFAPLSFVATECPDHVELTVSCSTGSGLEKEMDGLLEQITERLSPSMKQSRMGSGVSRDFPEDQTISHLFEKQVRISPHALAFPGVTYERLNQSANEVAHLLRSEGIGPGQIVGLLADRTENTMAGLFGILKAGAAYLPIDPQYPDDRVQFMLEDSGAQVCLTQNSYQSRVSAFFSNKIISFEDVDFRASRPPVELTAGPRDLVYVIYTSGSTGRPKGVQIEHRSLVNYVHWATEAYQVDSTTRFALFTSLAFDLSATSIFLPLLTGGSVELFPEELSHLTFRKILESGTINALKLTPTHLELLARLGLNPVGIKTVIVGGEQLKGSVALRAQEMFGKDCQIINEYGPTEATIGCMTFVFDSQRDGRLAAVPIGIPIQNTGILLLDSQRQEVAFGEVGEIFITGEGLARGYLNREELNREKFVQLKDGLRAYQTGDLAQILEDGQLLYLGRKDDQLKIRGYRIEPGEVESVLASHPQIAQAAVIGRSGVEGGDPTLWGYYVPSLIENGTPLKEDELRVDLEKKLPHYLVPSFLIPVKAIPMTVNGKVDVKSLPCPSFDQNPSRSSLLGRDEIERIVSSIWAQILEIEEEFLGLDSHFYELGGDSLKMVEMLAMVSETWGNEKGEERFLRQMRPVIQNPTLETVCRTIRACETEIAN
jgi:amino acid adenylation domain-containing protein